jgi:UDP-N-acetylmuramoylalanine--D-glutamate ligase
MGNLIKTKSLNMNYTIIGAARSGMAAALLAKELGHKVFLTESKLQEQFKESAEELIRAGIDFEFGGNTEKCYFADCIITSPGVPPTSSVLLEAEKRGIPIISELEFATQHLKNSIIAITGTNGKTTTTALTAFILNEAGRKAIACGNIGTPVSSLVNKISSDTILVIEVSSFQLDRISKFQPDVAVILNITPDHIGYHGSMERYVETKWIISSNQIEKNLLILNADDEAIRWGNAKTKATIAYISMSPVDWGIYNDGGMMKIRLPQQQKEEEIMLLDEIRLPGVHNAYNSMAAALAARVFEIRNEDIRDSLMKFAGVEHRLEFVRTLDGVDYVNDSKATNINATWYALISYKKPLIWIAGGRGDNNDYFALDESVQKNVKSIISIGEEQEPIFNHFSAMKRCFKEDSLEDALIRAKEIAETGDIVLFTPACKSFDMFMNYEHRGEVFKEIVNKL